LLIVNERHLGRVLKEYVQDRSELLRMTGRAMDFVGNEYSEDRERESIIGCWKKILEI